MIDEDAFGILLSYFQVEDDEYGTDDRAHFIARFRGFRRAALEVVEAMGLPDDHHVVCLGHAVYVELADAEDTPQLLTEFRRASGRLTAEGYLNVSVLSHGSRWVVEGQPPELSVSGTSPQVVQLSNPSEPLRKALHADSFARPDNEAPGWGAGVYVDVDALEALSKKPKNAPTELRACGGRYYRIPGLEATTS